MLFVTEQTFKAGIDMIPLKGPLLSYHIYQDETMRRCVDLDFLVKKNDLQTIYVLFKGLGYHSDIMDVNLLSSGLLKHQKQIRIWHPERRIMIEFHHKLFPFDVFSRKDNYEFVAPYCIHEKFSGINVFAMKREFELLYVTVHGAFHQWSSLRWLYDTNDFLKFTSTDMKEMIALAEQFHLTKVLALYNRMASMYIESPCLFPVNSLVNPFLVRFCMQRIESISERRNGVISTIGQTIQKFRFQYFLIPLFTRRLGLAGMFFRRFVCFTKLKYLFHSDHEK